MPTNKRALQTNQQLNIIHLKTGYRIIQVSKTRVNHQLNILHIITGCRIIQVASKTERRSVRCWSSKLSMVKKSGPGLSRGAEAAEALHFSPKVEAYLTAAGRSFAGQSFHRNSLGPKYTRLQNMRCRSDALLVLLGVGIGSTALIGTSSTLSTTNGVSGQSSLGVGLSVVEAFSPSYSSTGGIRFANSCRPGGSSSAALYAEDASSSSSADTSADTTEDGEGRGISMEAGGQLTTKKSSSSSADNDSDKMSEYRPLQRQWWEGARAAEEAGPSSSGQGFFSTTTDRSRQSQGGLTSGISRYAPQKDVQRLQKRQAMQRIAASASVGSGRWHEGAGSSGVYGTHVIGGGAGRSSTSTNVIGGFESDTDKARRERMEKQRQEQQQAEQQAKRAADVAQLAASMAENEDADLNDNPEVADTIMADMSGSWEVPTPEEVENMQIDPSELPEEFVEEDNLEEDNYVSEKPKSQGTVTGEWAVGSDHKMKQSRRPPSGGRGFES